MDNLREMDKFFEKHNLPRLNQDKTEAINRLIVSTDIEIVIKIFQQAKAQDQMASQAISITTFDKS